MDRRGQTFQRVGLLPDYLAGAWDIFYYLWLGFSISDLASASLDRFAFPVSPSWGTGIFSLPDCLRDGDRRNFAVTKIA
jgi:hypothetical protein